jgi:hypothetical protein
VALHNGLLLRWVRSSGPRLLLQQLWRLLLLMWRLLLLMWHA